MDKLRKWLPTFELREGDMTKDIARFEKLEKMMSTKSSYFPDDIRKLYRKKYRDVYQKIPLFFDDEPKILYHVYSWDDGYGSKSDLNRFVNRTVERIFNKILETERIVHDVVKRIFKRVEYKRKRELGTLLVEKITRDFGSAVLSSGRRIKAMYEIDMYHRVLDYTIDGRYCYRDCYLHIVSCTEGITGLRVRCQPRDESITEGMIAGEIEIFHT